MKRNILKVLIWKLTGKCTGCGGDYTDRGWIRYCPTCVMAFIEEDSPLHRLRRMAMYGNHRAMVELLSGYVEAKEEERENANKDSDV